MSLYKRSFLTKRDIYNSPTNLYLSRYILFRTPWFSIYLHKFLSSDLPVLHDHPYSFISMPLKKGYIENLPDGRTLNRKPFRPKFRTAEEFHWVELVDEEPAWSLFLTFRRRRKWGFWTKKGWVYWRDYYDIIHGPLWEKEYNENNS